MLKRDLVDKGKILVGDRWQSRDDHGVRSVVSLQ